MGLKQIVKELYAEKIGVQQYKQAAKAYIFAEYQQLRAREQSRLPDNLALKGYKVYSQNDEDGVIDAVFSILGGGRTFLEIGVEDGRECNTHLLLLKGWSGAWIDGNATSCAKIREALGGTDFPPTFRIQEQFVYPDNIVALYQDTCRFLGTENLDLFSLDIDGNDSYVIDRLLASGARPRVCCVEYNGKFPADVDISVAFRADRGWARDDYFGASLGCFDRILSGHGYRLVTCNLTGANAFYVDEAFAGGFPLRTPADVWQPLRLDLSPLPAGHRPSLGFLRDVVNNKGATAPGAAL